MPLSGPVQSAAVAHGEVQMSLMHQSLAHSVYDAQAVPSADVPDPNIGKQAGTQPVISKSITVGQALQLSPAAQSALERQ